MQQDEYVVMPNHIHGIINLTVGAPLVGAQNGANIQTYSQSHEGQPQTKGNHKGLPLRKPIYNKIYID